MRLTTLNRADLSLDDNQSSITTSQITTITSSNLSAAGGADLTLPALSQYSNPSGATAQASGTGTILDLTHLTTLAGATGFNSLNVDAELGGKVDLSKLTSYTAGKTAFTANGTGSIIDLSQLGTLLSDASDDSVLEAENGGSIETGGTDDAEPRRPVAGRQRRRSRRARSRRSRRRTSRLPVGRI